MKRKLGKVDLTRYNLAEEVLEDLADVEIEVEFSNSPSRLHTLTYLDPNDDEPWSRDSLSELDRGHVYELSVTPRGRLKVYMPFRAFAIEEYAMITALLGPEGRLKNVACESPLIALKDKQGPVYYPCCFNQEFTLPFSRKLLNELVEYCNEKGYLTVVDIATEEDLSSLSETWNMGHKALKEAEARILAVLALDESFSAAYYAMTQSADEVITTGQKFISCYENIVAQNDPVVTLRYRSITTVIRSEVARLTDAKHRDLVELMQRIAPLAENAAGQNSTQVIREKVLAILRAFYPVLGSNYLKNLSPTGFSLLTFGGEEVTFSLSGAATLPHKAETKQGTSYSAAELIGSSVVTETKGSPQEADLSDL
jgi:hypothetical protein